MPLETGISLDRDIDKEPWGVGGGSFTGKFERQMKKGSGYGLSLSLSLSLWERGETRGSDPLLGTLKAT
jgi:hypothetical protein